MPTSLPLFTGLELFLRAWEAQRESVSPSLSAPPPASVLSLTRSQSINQYHLFFKKRVVSSSSYNHGYCIPEFPYVHSKPPA